MIYEQFGDLKYKYRNRSFWCVKDIMSIQSEKMNAELRNIYDIN